MSATHSHDLALEVGECSHDLARLLLLGRERAVQRHRLTARCTRQLAAQLSGAAPCEVAPSRKLGNRCSDGVRVCCAVPCCAVRCTPDSTRTRGLYPACCTAERSCALRVVQRLRLHVSYLRSAGSAPRTALKAIAAVPVTVCACAVPCAAALCAALHPHSRHPHTHAHAETHTQT